MKFLGYLNTPPFLYIASIANVTALVFLVLRDPVTLYLDAMSTLVKKYLYVFPSKAYLILQRYLNEITLLLLIRYLYVFPSKTLQDT